MRIDNENDNDFMFKKFKELADSKSNANFDDFANGFKACYNSFNSGYDELELREKVKEIGVEDYFNDHLDTVVDKIEDVYPEIANEIANKRLHSVIKSNNLNLGINVPKEHSKRMVVDFISNELDGQDRIDFIKELVNLL